MELFAIVIFVISEEVLKLLEIEDDPQSQMTNAEVITFSLISARYFSINFKLSRYLCDRLGLFPKILSNSRLNRRIHQIPWVCWNAIFRLLALIFKQTYRGKGYAVDSFPIACCQKNRIDKRKIFIERKYLGGIYLTISKRCFSSLFPQILKVLLGLLFKVCPAKHL